MWEELRLQPLQSVSKEHVQQIQVVASATSTLLRRVILLCHVVLGEIVKSDLSSLAPMLVELALPAFVQ
jgi:hypothetical protein